MGPVVEKNLDLDPGVAQVAEQIFNELDMNGDNQVEMDEIVEKVPSPPLPALPSTIYTRNGIKRITKWFPFRPFLNNTSSSFFLSVRYSICRNIRLLNLSPLLLSEEPVPAPFLFAGWRKKNKLQELGTKFAAESQRVQQNIGDVLSGSDSEETFKAAVSGV